MIKKARGSANLLGHGVDRRGCMRRWDQGHDARVDDTKALDPVDLQVGRDHAAPSTRHHGTCADWM